MMSYAVVTIGARTSKMGHQIYANKDIFDELNLFLRTSWKLPLSTEYLGWVYHDPLSLFTALGWSSHPYLSSAIFMADLALPDPRSSIGSRCNFAQELSSRCTEFEDTGSCVSFTYDLHIIPV